MYKGKANHRNPPQETGPSAKPGKRGGGPSGSGWLVARVPVAWVKDHHRTTERHTPQPARVSLAELRGFLELSLGELWLDLRIRSRLRRQAARAAAEC